MLNFGGTFLLLFLHFFGTFCIPFEDFVGFPFGTQYGDSALTKDDDRTAAVLVNESFPFFGVHYELINIDINGLLSFHHPDPDPLLYSLSHPRHLPLMVSETWFPMIALFWGDVDLRHPEAGNVYYRVVSHEHHSALLEEINKLLDTNSRLDIRFAATWCLIVTWDNVGYYSNGRDKLNTFQAVLATNGTVSVAILNYADDGIQWSYTDSGFVIVGYNVGDGTNSKIIVSSVSFPNISKFIEELMTSNTGIYGHWTFRIDISFNTSIGPVCRLPCLNGGRCTGDNFCTCLAGWKGMQCNLDVNECLEGTDQCDQLCINTIGSYTCDCHAGYKLGSDGQSCSDIDECKTGQDMCSQLCNNTLGSYKCYCKVGYELISKKDCKDIRCVKEYFVSSFENIAYTDLTITIYSISSNRIEVFGPSGNVDTVYASPNSTNLFQYSSNGPYRIRTRSEEPVYVFASSIHTASAGGYKVFFPDGEYRSSAHLYRYFALSVAQSRLVLSRPESALVLVGAKNDTSVHMIPSETAELFSLQVGRKKRFKINNNEKITFFSHTDISGTEIKASNPLTVTSGHTCGNVPVNRHFCDQLIEQIPPTSDLGRQYIVVPFAGRTADTILKIVATELSTSAILYCDSESSQTISLSIGGVFEQTISINDTCLVSSNKPILVGLLSPGKGKLNVNENLETQGDPSLVILPSIESYSTMTAFYSFPGDDTLKHYATIFTTESAFMDANVFLDSHPIRINHEHPVHPQLQIIKKLIETPRNDLPNYVSIMISFHSTTGMHEVRSINNSTFGLISYGFGNDNGYAYSGHILGQKSCEFELDE